MPIYTLLGVRALSQVGGMLTFVTVVTRLVLQATGSAKKTGLVEAWKESYWQLFL